MNNDKVNAIKLSYGMYGKFGHKLENTTDDYKNVMLPTENIVCEIQYDSSTRDDERIKGSLVRALAEKLILSGKMKFKQFPGHNPYYQSLRCSLTIAEHGMSTVVKQGDVYEYHKYKDMEFSKEQVNKALEIAYAEKFL